MESLRKVLLGTFVFFAFAAVGAGMYAVTRPAPPPSRASEVISNVTVRKSGNFVLVSFTTAVPVQSKIVFTESVSGQGVEKVITTRLQTSHSLATDELNTSQDVYYQIFVYDAEAKELGRSDEIKLMIQNSKF